MFQSLISIVPFVPSGAKWVFSTAADSDFHLSIISLIPRGWIGGSQSLKAAGHRAPGWESSTPLPCSPCCFWSEEWTPRLFCSSYRRFLTRLKPGWRMLPPCCSKGSLVRAVFLWLKPGSSNRTCGSGCGRWSWGDTWRWSMVATHLSFWCHRGCRTVYRLSLWLGCHFSSCCPWAPRWFDPGVHALSLVIAKLFDILDYKIKVLSHCQLRPGTHRTIAGSRKWRSHESEPCRRRGEWWQHQGILLSPPSARSKMPETLWTSLGVFDRVILWAK